MNNFAVFILTHGRPDNVITIQTLKNCGYTGRIVLIVDNEDKAKNEYIKKFGKNNVEVFDKKRYADKIDEGNNFDERRTITHARNASFDIAKKIGINYFMQLDDDYTSFMYMFFHTEKLHNPIKNFNSLVEYFLEFYKNTNCLSIAFSQGGDWIGGKLGGPSRGVFPFIKRKAMNSFICSTERPFNFIGAMNEDVNTYTTLGSRGELFLTIPLVSLNQKQTQSQPGGITDMYLKFGTLAKSFTTVMMMPSCVKATYQPQMGRIHHSINWKVTVPKIIDRKYKKSIS